MDGLWTATKWGPNFGDNWDCVSFDRAAILGSSRRGKRDRIRRVRSTVPGPKRWLRPPGRAASVASAAGTVRLFLRDVFVCPWVWADPVVMRGGVAGFWSFRPVTALSCAVCPECWPHLRGRDTQARRPRVAPISVLDKPHTVRAERGITTRILTVRGFRSGSTAPAVLADHLHPVDLRDRR